MFSVGFSKFKQVYDFLMIAIAWVISYQCCCVIPFSRDGHGIWQVISRSHQGYLLVYKYMTYPHKKCTYATSTILGIVEGSKEKFTTRNLQFEFPRGWYLTKKSNPSIWMEARGSDVSMRARLRVLFFPQHLTLSPSTSLLSKFSLKWCRVSRVAP